MRNSIANLPTEIFVDIFRHLDQKSLNAAILTCKWWKEIIESYCSWSIGLRSDHISYITVAHLMETKRKFKIKLTVTDNIEKHLIDICKLIGCRVTELIWDNSRLGNGLWFLELLKYLPNLEYIRLVDVNLPEVPDDCDLPDLKKLKTLGICACTCNIFKCFRASNLKSLAIEEIDVPSMFSLQRVVDFVGRQKNLKKLTLVQDFEDTFFQQLCGTRHNQTMPFQLAHLIVHTHLRTNERIGLVNFIKINSETLRKLQLYGKLPNPIFEFIFGQLKSLKFLGINRLAKKPEFGENLKKNRSIDDLVLVSKFFSPIALSHFCECVPNVKNLTLWQDWNAERLQIISKALSKVTTLCVLKFHGNFNEIKFPNLTSFYIAQLNDVDWNAFTEANSGITEIIIKSVDTGVLKLDHVDVMTRNLKLQKLKIGEGFSTDERLLSIIRKNCSELKVLDLHKSCGITVPVGSFVSLRLCDEIKFPDSFQWYGVNSTQYAI